MRFFIALWLFGPIATSTLVGYWLLYRLWYNGINAFSSLEGYATQVHVDRIVGLGVSVPGTILSAIFAYIIWKELRKPPDATR